MHDSSLRHRVLCASPSFTVSACSRSSVLRFRCLRRSLRHGASSVPWTSTHDRFRPVHDRLRPRMHSRRCTGSADSASIRHPGRRTGLSYPDNRQTTLHVTGGGLLHGQVHRPLELGEQLLDLLGSAAVQSAHHLLDVLVGLADDRQHRLLVLLVGHHHVGRGEELGHLRRRLG